MKAFESLTVISVEHYCKVNPAWVTCLKMINSWKHWHFKKLSNVISYIEKLQYLLHFE